MRGPHTVPVPHSQLSLRIARAAAPWLSGAAERDLCSEVQLDDCSVTLLIRANSTLIRGHPLLEDPSHAPYRPLHPFHALLGICHVPVLFGDRRW